MDKTQEAQLFESVARQHPRLVEWLKNALEAEKQTLVTIQDAEQFKRIQGRAQFCQDLLKRLSLR